MGNPAWVALISGGLAVAGTLASGVLVHKSERSRQREGVKRERVEQVIVTLERIKLNQGFKLSEDHYLTYLTSIIYLDPVDRRACVQAYLDSLEVDRDRETVFESISALQDRLASHL